MIYKVCILPIIYTTLKHCYIFYVDEQRVWLLGNYLYKLILLYYIYIYIICASIMLVTSASHRAR